MTTTEPGTIADRAAGVLLAGATGDALGVPYEYGSRPLPPPGEPPRMLGGGLGGILGGLLGGAAGGMVTSSAGTGGLGGLLGGLLEGPAQRGAQHSNDASFGEVFNDALARQVEPEIAPTAEQNAVAGLMLRAMIQAATAAPAFKQ